MKSALEILAGLALVIVPSTAISILVGQRLAVPAGFVLGRIGGVALLTLGIACWLARNAVQSRAAIGLVGALCFYDFSVVLILLSAHFELGLLGIGLWPAAALHSGLGIWSLLALRKATQKAVPG